MTGRFCVAVVIIAAVYIGAMVADMVFDRRTRLPPWTIMCNDAGKYTFVNEDGRLYSFDYDSRQEAQKQMLSSRALHEEYEVWRNRAATYKPCPEIETIDPK